MTSSSSDIVDLVQVERLFHECRGQSSEAQDHILKDVSPKVANCVRQQLKHSDTPPLLSKTKGEFEQVRDELQHGDRVGTYRILQEIGRGGMGVVYLAEDVHSGRNVAIKVIKRGMDTRDFLARFNAEFQALSLMNHTCVASVIGAGSTDDGRPFFAMEYVRGIPINEYCDQHRFEVADRLELFIHVCEGVHHAHQKGIIHRDVKPKNILVCDQDDRPHAKVIDFGVAKATGRRLTDQTNYTETGRSPTTLEYMSPEQADPTKLDIDIRSDIYSLGVVLYELLAGALPFDSLTLHKVGETEARRMIREDDPAAPSTRLKTLPETNEPPDKSPTTDKGNSPTPSNALRANPGSPAWIAQHRRTDVNSLSKQLRGDLDCIAMKALAKERTHRYASANEFAADIQRYLDDQPIIARPVSKIYQFRKFGRRHKGAVLAATVSILALVVGLTGALGGYIRAAREATAAKQSKLILDCFVDLISPNASTREKKVARQLVQGSTEQTLEHLTPQTLQLAALYFTIGEYFREVGNYNDAILFADAALGIRERLLGLAHNKTVESLARVGELQFRLGRSWEGENTLRKALTVARGLDPVDDSSVADVANRLGMILAERGAYDESNALNFEALKIRKRLPAEAHWAEYESLQNLATALTRAGKHQEALPYYLEAFKISPDILREEGTPRGADERIFANVMASLSDSKDSNPLQTAIILMNLGNIFMDVRRDYPKAVSLLSEALAIQRECLPGDHEHIARTLTNLGAAQEEAGQIAQAETSLREALAIKRKQHGPEDVRTALTMNNLASVMRRAGKLEESESMARESLQIYKKHAPRGDWQPFVVEATLAAAIASQHRYSEAAPMLLRAYEVLKTQDACPLRTKQEVVGYLVQLYEGWNAVEPEKGYMSEAIKWRAQAEELDKSIEHKENYQNDSSGG